jgi:60S ribosome subunit biogenesis protein NIP7
MRPLTDEETKLVFEKLVKYIGKKITYMVDNEENNFVFRLHKNRVYYCNEEMIKFVINFEKKKLISFGTCLGKFTKTGKFRLNITALDYLAKYAQYKIWLKPNGEQLYLYGHHVIKSHIERISEDTPVHAGVVIFNIKDVPLGFGTTAKSAMDLKNAEPNNIVVYNQADIGEYLRVEEDN